MIKDARGNLLLANVDALVNTVNTEGIMGKGIALQFKNAYPAMFKDYAAAAKRGEVKLGIMHVWPTQALAGPRFIINFPTKAHWRSKSRIGDIERGLTDLVRVVRELGITSIAVPPLGAGNGGLNWADVEPLIRSTFEHVQDVEVLIYSPDGSPKPADMVINTVPPAMTPGRAALIGLITRYIRRSLNEPSIIEVQKLMYFMQVFGEPLNLKFEANRYGPYADNLRKVLREIEGHYLSGFGDGTAKVLDGTPLSPLPAGVPLAEEELVAHPETKVRMDRVLELADGYESAYGMELLSTVHWVAQNEAAGESDQSVAEKVAEWSPRKAQMFTRDHVSTALSTLREHGVIVST